MTTFQHISTSISNVQEKITNFLGRIDDGYKIDYVSDDSLERANYYWEGKTLEKGGVHFIKKSSKITPFIESMVQKENDNQVIELTSDEYHVTGISLIIHPKNPYVPTIHLNVRYFELGDVWWFGGGIDISPSYFNTDDIKTFHLQLKKICDEFGLDYGEYKVNCDNYFYLETREQTRGLGGIFFDHLKTNKEDNFNFIIKLASEFENIYSPFLKYINQDYTDIEREYSLLRRGIYAEFIYLYDRGIKFGLNTSIHIKSMFSSLPPLLKYSDEWKLTDEQSKLDAFFFKKTDWINYDE